MQTPKADSGVKTEDSHELTVLRAENLRLKSLLAQHGIAYDIEDQQLVSRALETASRSEPSAEVLTTSEKVALFRRLFCGREDVYALRWESSTGKSGYSPACANEWRSGVCEKPRVKCSDCNHRVLLPIDDSLIYDHLSGKKTVGVYALFNNDHCNFLAVDFDDADWQSDARAFTQSCRDFDIPSLLEVSRSGSGAHVWIFFSQSVLASLARQLGAGLLSHTCDKSRQLSLTSYDRLFPNQDTQPKGGFGNLIALPLQKGPRTSGFSVFVDDDLQPWPDQWSVLSSVKTVSQQTLTSLVNTLCAGHKALDVAFSADKDEQQPWENAREQTIVWHEPLPSEIELVLAGQIYIAKSSLPQQLCNRLIRLAAFQNPEFYKAQAMRLPVWNKPRIIGCAENHPKHISLPRGCLDAVKDLLSSLNISVSIRDERNCGKKIKTHFKGELRKDQRVALRAITQFDAGVLCAPTAFGKTVTAAALIAHRKVSTLVLVHRTELMRQWQERLLSFLELPRDEIGLIGGGKNKPCGKVDIAVLQSLTRREDLATLLDDYGQVIVDECHHLSAVSFEAVIKQSKARYVVGLTATPERRDGHHPIILMQCGPIRHRVKRSQSTPKILEVHAVELNTASVADASIQAIFRHLTEDESRNRKILDDILDLWRAGRKVLVLSERTDHLNLLAAGISEEITSCYLLHGKLAEKKRRAVLEELQSLNPEAPRVLIASGRLVGEGFDHPPLDTLVLSMPVSWKGTLQQYVGRLHRSSLGKNSVLVHDYIDVEQPQLTRMWEKRRKGYLAMGYTINS